MKLVSIIGTRPQLLKLAPLNKQFKQLNETNINHIIIHSGQHYDDNMSKVFTDTFNMNIDYNLKINGSRLHGMSHGGMTGTMLIEIEKILIKERPDLVLVFGDCNTTIAGALAASKLLIPVMHVEAGIRSFNMTMPEEQNRILTDHISTIFCCPTNSAIKNLHNEGIYKNIHLTGNLQIDLMEYCLEEYDMKPKYNDYYLMTVHRHYNTNKETLNKIFNAVARLDKQVIFPIHPRTRNVIGENNVIIPENLKLIDPIGYPEMVNLLKNCYKILTDSGGIQSEAYCLGKPCITLRTETEWPELLLSGWNVLADPNEDDVYNIIINHNPIKKRENIFGEGKCCENIYKIIENMNNCS
jgi:UDP-GlcNAc3NAcA epimerase